MLHKPSERRPHQEIWAISFTLQLLLKFKMHFQKTTTFCSQQLLIAKNIMTWNCVLETNNKCHITIFGFYYILHRHQFNTFNTPVRRSQVSLQDVWAEAWWFLVCPAGGLTASLWLCWAVQTGVDAADLPRHIVLMAERACCCVSSDSVAAKQPQLKTTK